jgi:hypothetical protein
VSTFCAQQCIEGTSQTESSVTARSATLVCQKAESAVNQNYGSAWICRLRAMRQTQHPVLAIGVASLVAGLLAPSAAADSAIPLGGGAGIVVAGGYCTLATIGRDHSGALVGFTAGHCGGPGADVVAEGANNGTVGTVTASDGALDYAVIKFDPGKVVPTNNFAGFPINGIMDAAPDFRQPACTQGAATGNYCGHIGSIPGPGANVTMHAPFQPGDDGRPVTCDGQLVGVVYEGHVIPGDLQGSPSIPDTHFHKFIAISNDVNAKGGPGAGFTPI